MRHDVATPEYLWFLNTLVRIRVSHAEGADGLSVIENWAPYADSPPLHIHHTEDELFHVLEGEFRFILGGEEHRAGPGELILTPRGVPHTYRVESPAGGRWLVVTTHGDFERFVRDLSRPAAGPELPMPAGPPTPEEAQALGALAMRHRIELVGPPLA
ncbi:MAG TPA: cupin domain-containing protein [Thermoanaerobaculia bacterium]